MFAMSRHDNLATCRRRFLDEPSELFLPILETVKEMKRLTWSKVCPDGTKIKANASRLGARSHGRIETDAELGAWLAAEAHEIRFEHLLELCEQAVMDAHQGKI